MISPSISNVLTRTHVDIVAIRKAITAIQEKVFWEIMSAIIIMQTIQRKIFQTNTLKKVLFLLLTQGIKFRLFNLTKTLGL